MDRDILIEFILSVGTAITRSGAEAVTDFVLTDPEAQGAAVETWASIHGPAIQEEIEALREQVDARVATAEKIAGISR